MSFVSRCLTCRRFATGVTVAVLFALLVPTVRAAEKTDSLDWAPEDVAFYSSSRRLKEQVQIVLKSNAAKQVMEMPFVQMGLAELKKQMDDPTQPAGMVKVFFDLPENKQLLDLLGDMGSREMVIYGDNDWIASFDLLRKMQKISNQIQAEMLEDISRIDLDDPTDEDSVEGDAEKRMGRAYIELLRDNLDKCKVPATVMAFRLSEKVPAETQLKRLEVLASAFFKTVPELKDALSRKKIDGTDYLTFTLEAKNLPWDEVPLEEFEEKKGEYKKVFDHIKSLKVVANLGVWDGWLILSIAGSDEHLAKLGKGKTLRNRKEFAKLAEFKDHRLTGVNYASDSFMKATSDLRQTIDDLVDTVNIFLPLAEIPDATRHRISGDVKELGDDIKASLPVPGAILNFSYLTKDGINYKSYNWSSNSMYDGSKPLTILKHVGGSPLLAVAARAKYKPEQYDTMKKWIKKGYKYVEEFALPELSEKERKEFDKVAEQVYPLLRRLDETTAKKLIPSLADGQSAIVLDAKLASKQWVREMPEAKVPLVIPEPAMVLGVSDAKMLKQAFVEYREIANDAIKAMRKISPDEIPPFEIPPLHEKKVAGGNVYFHPLPKQVYDATGLDKRLLPNAGLSPSIATLSISEKHTERLLSETSLAATGPLKNTDRKAAMAVYFNWAGMVDMAKPWVDYGFAQAAVQGEFGPADAADGLPPNAKMILAHVHQGMEILKCFRDFESITYKEGDVWVSEGQWRFQDVK